MYEIYAAATGAKIIAVPAGGEFRFPLENVLARINERTRLIAVANPNNPTGTLASRNDLLKIAEHAPNSAILIDEAYFEFCGETLLPEFRKFANLFVSRTFSKAYGLAGLRIGVLAGHPDQMHFVRPVSSPYNVNSIALACLPDALADQDYIRQYVEEVLGGRERLERELQDWGIRYWPSRANFVLYVFGLRKLRHLFRRCGSVEFWFETAPATMGVQVAFASRLARSCKPTRCSLRCGKLFEQIGMRQKVRG